MIFVHINAQCPRGESIDYCCPVGTDKILHEVSKFTAAIPIACKVSALWIFL